MEIAITEMLARGFESVYPESEENKELSRYKFGRRNKYLDYYLPDHCFGFFDWFCRDFALRNKAKRLFSIVKSIVRKNTSAKFDPSKCYVFFKNNCPCYGDGRNYDDIRICDIESGDVIMNICPRDPFGRATISYEGHGFEDDTEELRFGNLRELENWFSK